MRLSFGDQLKWKFGPLLTVTVLFLTIIVSVNAQNSVKWRAPHQNASDNYDWTRFLHDDQHTGVSSSIMPETNELAWKYSVGDPIYTSPAVSDGRVYAGSEDGKVVCLDSSTGSELWSFTAGVWSSPTVANNRVYFGSQDKKIYCLNALDGKLIWSFITSESVASSPLVISDRLYIGTYGPKGVYCLNALTGQEIWSYPTTGQVWSSPSHADGRIYFGDLQGFTVYCIDALTGSNIWSYKTNGMIWSSPAVAEGRVYVGSVDNSLYCLNALDGSLIWSYKTEGYVESSPAVFGEKVYVGSFDKKMYCLDAVTGAVIWEYATDGTIWSSPAIADGKICFGSYDDSFYCLNLDTGVKLWSYKTGGYIFSSPAVAEGKVYVGSSDGNLYSFGPTSAVNAVWVPSTQGVIAAAAVTVGTLASVSALSSIVSVSGSTGSQSIDVLIKKIYDMFPEALKSWLEDLISSKNKAESVERTGSLFIPTGEEALAYITTVVTLTLAYSYVKSPVLQEIWKPIPIILGTSVLFVFAKTYLSIIISRRFGVWAEHRIWNLGFILFAFSTIIFRFPFSYPSRLERHTSKITPRIGGLLNCASIIITLVFALIFYIIMSMGFTLVGSIGLIMCVTSAFFEALPVSPMGGKDIYDWRKQVWGILFLSTLVVLLASLIYL